MLVDATVRATSAAGMIAEARRVEAGPYAGLWMPESAHDPFISLAFAAEHTERVTIGTAIAVAFARNPMSLAYSANDLQYHAEGRFVLGLGSQVKGHIERRFSMPWSKPAARMEELITALRAIWASWRDGTRLDFRGDFYQHTLMTSFFSPGPNPFGPPKVHLAAVGAAMTAVAGRVADGLIVHPFTTERYLREVTMPTLSAEASGAGRPTPVLQLSPIVVTGPDEDKLEAAIDATRRQVAFYASTPAYRGVLELHGWGALGEELLARSKGDDDGRWLDMAKLIDDEVLHAFAVVAPLDRVGDALVDRFGGLVDRIGVYAPYKTDPAMWDGVAVDLARPTVG